MHRTNYLPRLPLSLWLEAAAEEEELLSRCGRPRLLLFAEEGGRDRMCSAVWSAG